MRADLAFIGFGNVGRRFARLLGERRERLEADDDLTWRIVGISTARHGSTWCVDGVNSAEAAARVEAGLQLSSDAEPPTASRSREIIARLGKLDADLRVVIETTTLDITAGQ